MDKWHINCAWCGQFTSPEVGDVFTPFGQPYMSEPPDEVVICSRCSMDWESYMVRAMSKCKWWGVNWRPSRAERSAVERAGFALAGPKGAAWCEAFRSDLVPSDYEVWENTLEADND